tara:strand:- start:407 stop:649 length:243 start_codon:yes stop_codon:yes gene_type:complete
MVTKSKYSAKAKENMDLDKVHNGYMTPSQFAAEHGYMPDVSVKRTTAQHKKDMEKAVAMMKAKQSPTHLTGPATQKKKYT